MQTLDFAHLDKSTPEQFIEFLKTALADKHSENFKSLYEFLFKCFVESDKEEKGAIHFEQFDGLIEDVAQAPRALGLAPTSAQSYPTVEARKAARLEEFNAMDFDQSGTVTFDKFLGWCLQHIQQKVENPTYVQPAPQPVVAQPARVVQAAPVTYAAPAQAAPISYAAPATYAAPVTYAAPATYAAPVTYAAAPTYTSITR